MVKRHVKLTCLTKEGKLEWFSNTGKTLSTNGCFYLISMARPVFVQLTICASFLSYKMHNKLGTLYYYSGATYCCRHHIGLDKCASKILLIFQPISLLINYGLHDKISYRVSPTHNHRANCSMQY